MTAGTPRLLSGDNPQIAMGGGDAPVQAYIAAVPGWKQDACRGLDALITGLVPGVRKAVKWNSPLYGVGAETDGWFLSLHCFARYVKIAFFRGALLDPPPPEPSKSGDTRYLHLREGDPLDDPKLAAWIGAASRLPGERL